MIQCFILYFFLGVYVTDYTRIKFQFLCNDKSVWFLVTFTFQSISAYSGHYRPTDDTLDTFLSYLKKNGVNLDEVKVIDYLQHIFMT